MISGGLVEEDSANATKTSLKRTGHEVLSGYLRP